MNQVASMVDRFHGLFVPARCYIIRAGRLGYRLHCVTVTRMINGNPNIVHTLISGSVRWARVVVTCVCVWRVVIFGVVET